MEELFHNVLNFSNPTILDRLGDDLEKISKDLVKGTMKTINTASKDICTTGNDLDQGVSLNKIKDDIISIINHLKSNIEDIVYNLKNDFGAVHLPHLQILGENFDNMKD